MRFSSIAIIFQSASIFLTVLAVYTKSHIPEERKNFLCGGRSITYSEYSWSSLVETTNVSGNRNSWSWANQLSHLMSDSSNQNFVLFGPESEVSKFFILQDLTTGGPSDYHNHVFEYIVLVDKIERTCGMIMRVLSRVNSNSASSPGQNISLCSIED
ncbi:Bgt-50543 [Blumeria graminis f. sp. tritici]|uniref:Bgt-50543 n=1 Tax=Blumeria graminis f. sp. tritici TaxID=62690 RepID=A0A9X9QD31_BLUGR|nr:Bgt-50543 [Blumeria graminis f. sp. tritici]